MSYATLAEADSERLWKRPVDGHFADGTGEEPGHTGVDFGKRAEDTRED